MKIEESVLINRPTQEVFGYLEVRAHDADWMEAVVESLWLDDTATSPTSSRWDRSVIRSARIIYPLDDQDL
jgi:hypothetical protein